MSKRKLHIDIVTRSKINVDEAYDSPPIWYDIRGLFILWVTYKSTLRKQVVFFSQFEKNHRHLEVAIGSGSLFRIIYCWSFIKRKFPTSVIGFDYAPSMLAGALKKFKGNKTIQLEVADATYLPYESESFDSVHLANAVHCIPDYPKALTEIYRVLKDDGVFRVNVLLPPQGFLKSISNRVNQWGIRKGILQGPIESTEFIEHLQKLNFKRIENFRQGNCLYVKARKDGF